MKMAHAPPGHHSVIGRPSVGGLFYPEYVVYRGEQVRFINWINFTSFINHTLKSNKEYIIYAVGSVCEISVHIKKHFLLCIVVTR